MVRFHPPVRSSRRTSRAGRARAVGNLMPATGATLRTTRRPGGCGALSRSAPVAHFVHPLGGLAMVPFLLNHMCRMAHERRERAIEDWNLDAAVTAQADLDALLDT